MTPAEKRVIAASSMGTILEMYDFFLVGALSSEIAKHFFAGVNPSAAFILSLLGFAAGFVMRPFGGMVFGRFGDMFGRKRTFLATILLMGVATFVIGLLPGYASIGLTAPILFVLMRMLQGLAIGGEFGGAFIYVAEHGSKHDRGFRISWVVSTGAGGLLLSLLVVLPLRYFLGDATFFDWGWRLPFLFSILILLVSLWIRLKLDESPEFLRMKAEGGMSKAPIAETLGEWKNLRLILIAVFGVMMGTVIIFYNGQLYTMFFLTKLLKVDPTTTNILVISATLLTAPLYLVFGKLTDVVGRKKVLVAGCLLGSLFTMPLFKGLTHYANPALEKAQLEAPIVVRARQDECAFQFDPTGTAKFTSSCDIVTSSLAKAGLNYSSLPLESGEVAQVHIGSDIVEGYRASDPDVATKAKQFNAQLQAAAAKHGYNNGIASKDDINTPMVLLILMALISFSAMVFTASIAMLVEMFPTRIRYTAISIPYHLSSAVFGGFLPATSFAIVAATGNIYSGLWYPILASLLSALILIAFAKETKGAS
ncbi:MFS transporter [Herbaspirillum lusitanum]|uniref:MFS transporter n=1 Tax=Herbaspirillum lusitanum TaxID=213312 RepID=UPI0022379893|nr:MFS transporter [Herbaspirillum lusitanum]MCW5297794.1 MFS transporter [Herbaspirillum lusitanum]